MRSLAPYPPKVRVALDRLLSAELELERAMRDSFPLGERIECSDGRGPIIAYVVGYGISDVRELRVENVKTGKVRSVAVDLHDSYGIRRMS
jgi:hypothetical protein